MTYNMILLLGYLALIVIASLLAIHLYHKDKKLAAKNTEARIKEKYLLSISVFGGAIGAFIARISFRHKTNKSYFSITIYLSLLIQLAVLALLVYMAIKTRG